MLNVPRAYEGRDKKEKWRFDSGRKVRPGGIMKGLLTERGSQHKQGSILSWRVHLIILNNKQDIF